MFLLKLTLKREWFDMILYGDKREEYRDVKAYFTSRLFSKEGKRIPYDAVEFTNGYNPDSPSFIIQYKGVSMGRPKPYWINRENVNGHFYIIKLGHILSTKNLRE